MVKLAISSQTFV